MLTNVTPALVHQLSVGPIVCIQLAQTEGVPDQRDNRIRFKVKHALVADPILG